MNRKRLLIIAFAIVVVSNLLILGKVAYNRAVSSAELVFSERELAAERYSPKHDGGQSLQLRWNTAGDDNGWRSLKVSANTMQELGFNADCGDHYSRKRSERKAFVLMELAGKTWQNELLLAELRLQQKLAETDDPHRQEFLQNELKQWQQHNTRLYAVAVATGAEPLAAAITDSGKQFVLSGNVSCGDEPNTMRIDRLPIDTLNVRRELL